MFWLGSSDISRWRNGKPRRCLKMYTELGGFVQCKPFENRIGFQRCTYLVRKDIEVGKYTLGETKKQGSPFEGAHPVSLRVKFFWYYYMIPPRLLLVWVYGKNRSYLFYNEYSWLWGHVLDQFQDSLSFSWKRLYHHCVLIKIPQIIVKKEGFFTTQL